LLFKKVATGESCSTRINDNHAVPLQELGRHAGVVIMTTNLFKN